MELFSTCPNFADCFWHELDSVTDEGFQQLSALSSLELLDIWSVPQFTDRSVEVLAKLPNLKELSLRSTGITDASIEALLAMPKLQTLTVKENSDVSDKARSTLGSYLDQAGYGQMKRCDVAWVAFSRDFSDNWLRGPGRIWIVNSAKLACLWSLNISSLASGEPILRRAPSRGTIRVALRGDPSAPSLPTTPAQSASARGQFPSSLHLRLTVLNEKILDQLTNGFAVKASWDR